MFFSLNVPGSALVVGDGFVWMHRPYGILIARSDLTRIYTSLNRLNDDMASAYTIRQQNFAEMQKNLNAVNSVLKSSIRLRGK